MPLFSTLNDSPQDFYQRLTSTGSQPSRAGQTVNAPNSGAGRAAAMRAQAAAAPGLAVPSTASSERTAGLMAQMTPEAESTINWPPPPIPHSNGPSLIGELAEAGSAVDQVALGSHNDIFSGRYDERAPGAVPRMDEPTDSATLWESGSSGAIKAASAPTEARGEPTDHPDLEEPGGIFDLSTYIDRMTGGEGFAVARGAEDPAFSVSGAPGEAPRGERRDTGLFRELQGSEKWDAAISGLFYGLGRKNPFLALEGARARANEIRGIVREDEYRDVLEDELSAGGWSRRERLRLEAGVMDPGRAGLPDPIQRSKVAIPRGLNTEQRAMLEVDPATGESRYIPYGKERAVRREGEGQLTASHLARQEKAREIRNRWTMFKRIPRSRLKQLARWSALGEVDLDEPDRQALAQFRELQTAASYMQDEGEAKAIQAWVDELMQSALANEYDEERQTLDRAGY